MSKPFKRAIGLIVCLIIFIVPSFAQIDLAAVKKHVYALSDDSMQGRNTSTPGGKMAAAYIVQQYENIGLQPMPGNNKYLQAFTYFAGKEYKGKNELSFDAKKQILDTSYYALNISGNGSVKGKAIFVNQGLELPNKKSDYEGLSVAGKIVMIDIGYPEGFDPHSDNAKYADLTTRAETAVKYGAKAVIFFKKDPNQDNPLPSFDRKVKEVSIPVLFLKNYIISSSLPIIKLSVNLTKVYKTADNVVGLINNNKPYTIVVGAHYDHLGFGENGNSLYRGTTREIHNGADDNASGVAAIIELARYYKNCKTNEYNYMFIAFSGEELGLYGSKSFVDNLNNVIDSTKINCMINLDMVGRLTEKDKNLEINGIGTSTQWPEIIKSINIEGIRVKEGQNGIGPSDHTSFYLKNIPVLHFFTGQHEDYHKPSDDAEKVNYEGLQKVCNYIIQTINKVNANPKLSFVKTKEENNENTPRFKVTLGIVPDYMFDGEGVRIDGVSDGKPASKAGLQKGDIVIQLGGIIIADMNSYMKALSQFSKGQQTQVIYIRNKEKKEASLQF